MLVSVWACLADLKTGFERGSANRLVLSDLVEVDVLAIDELGKGRNTEWEGTVLDELISRRYNAAATVLATTNYAPKRTGHATPNLTDAPATQPGLPDRVGDRVYSRLHELCDFISLPGTDFRLRQAKAARARRVG